MDISSLKIQISKLKKSPGPRELTPKQQYELERKNNIRFGVQRGRLARSGRRVRSAPIGAGVVTRAMALIESRSPRRLSSAQRSARRRAEDKEARANVHLKRAKRVSDFLARLNNLGVPLAGIGSELTKSASEALAAYMGQYKDLPEEAEILIKYATRMAIAANNSSIDKQDLQKIEEAFAKILKAVDSYKKKRLGRSKAAFMTQISEYVLEMNAIVATLAFEK
jgi:hypothetical protein